MFKFISNFPTVFISTTIFPKSYTIRAEIIILNASLNVHSIIQSFIK